jgi:L-threonylcarbamoyladenylate synthase
MQNEWKKVQMLLKKDGVVITPTDTLYGVLGSVLSKKAVEKIYKVRGRDKDKPCIVLITSMLHLKKFDVVLDQDQKEFLEKFWPGKVSVVLPVKSAKWKYLHRGKKSIAFRMIGPRNKNLYNLINSVGSLVAPSANPQGAKPARNRKEARKYFGTQIDAYICGGTRNSPPSTLIEYKNGKWVVLREGAIRI